MKIRILAGLSLASLMLSGQSLPEMRMLPAEMRGSAVDGDKVGSSGLAGSTHPAIVRRSVKRRILFDPAVRARSHDHSGARPS